MLPLRELALLGGADTNAAERPGAPATFARFYEEWHISSEPLSSADRP